MSDIQDRVIAIVQYAVGGTITARSSSGNDQAWDSLAHIEVLDGLDQAWPGITGKYPDLSSAESVSEIVEIVSRDSV